MNVNIDELEEIVSLLLKKLKHSKGKEIELNNDYYWEISNDEVYNPYEEPKNISLGQLSEDINELNRLVNKDDDAIPYDLSRIGNILKALSNENQIAF